MRAMQFRILKGILEKIEIPEYIYAFEKEKSIPKMSVKHINKQVVVSVDLKDFFGSIKQFHLEQLFQLIGIGGKAGRTLSELCTYTMFVPQGALTSPKVSNVVTAMTFGPLIKAYCDEKGYELTIYADDITISSNTPLDGKEGRETQYDMLNFLEKQVSLFGFRINDTKTKVMTYDQRQYVCGAVVNQKVNLQKSERHTLRAIVHNCEKNGIEFEASKNNVTGPKFAEIIMGKLNWFTQLNPTVGGRVKSQFTKVVMEQSQPNAIAKGVEKVITPGSEIPVKQEETTFTF